MNMAREQREPMLNNFPLRTALCIAGLPRTMEYCFPSQKEHLLDVYHPDVFTFATAADRDRVVELYRPNMVCMLSEDFVLEEALKLRRGLSTIPYPPSALPSSYKMLQCVKNLRDWEHLGNFKYDVVFISRFDVKFKKIQPVEPPEQDTLYVPRVGGYWATPPAEPGIHWGGYSGHLCWTTSKVALQLANIYYDPQDWYKRSVESSGEWGNAAEYLLKFYCEQNGIQVKFVDIDMMLIRGTSEAPLSFNWQDLSAYPGY